MPDQQLIAKEEAINEVRKACYHFADLYFHFAVVLFKELGPEKAKKLIEQVIRNRAIERGEKLRKKAADNQLPTNQESWSKVTDIPFLGWDKSLGRLECPYAAAWLARYDDNPWFPEIAQLYCNVNDPQVSESFTGATSQRITKNVLAGDEYCDREYFEIKR